MYPKLKALIAEHQLTQKDVAKIVPLGPTAFNQKINRFKGSDFTISQGKNIQRYFHEKGSEYTLDEIFLEK